MESANKYYFHCDNELLKYNKDYQSLLRTLGVLEAQKVQVIKDLELLEEIKSQTKTQPNEVLRKLKEGSLKFPTRQKIVDIPDVNLEQYGASLYANNNNYNMRKRDDVQQPTVSLNDKNTSSSGGKIKEGKKNKRRQPWTEQEQAKLESLLQVYPPEEVEAKRWQKIASQLENRTAKQVCCRVQKYFIKLAKAGLPVPGRMPNLSSYGPKGKMKRRAKRRIKSHSIFFNSLKPRVYMDYSKDEEEEESVLSSEESYSSSSEDVLCCTGCSASLLSCVYWECIECTSSTVLLCQTCVNTQWNNGVHSPTHEMKHVNMTQDKEGLKYIDKDYTCFNPSLNNTSYNYLDANFHPAL